MKLDYVVARHLNLNSLNNTMKEMTDCTGHRFYILMNNSFKELVTNGEVKEISLKSLGSRQLVLYVENVEDGGLRDSSVDKNIDSEELYDSDYNIDEESENDDELYEINVSKQVVDGVDRNDPSSDDDYSEEDEDVVHEDRGFDEHKLSDGEREGPNHSIFNPEVIFEPEFELGMIFSSKNEFKMAVQSLAIKTKRSLKFTKFAPTRMYVVCEDPKCRWNIHLNKIACEETFQIRQYMANHTCDPTFRVKNVKSRWLSEKFMRKFVVEPNRKVNVYREDAMDGIGCDISKD